MSRFQDNTSEFIQSLAEAVESGLQAASMEGAERAAASIPGAGAGVVGKTATSRNIYASSTPGSPPGWRTGQLENSLANARIQRFSWGFGTRLRYGRHLEYGFRTSGGQPFFKKDGEIIYASRKSPHASRMAKTKPAQVAARPFLRPVLVRDRAALENAFVTTAARKMATGIAKSGE